MNIIRSILFAVCLLVSPMPGLLSAETLQKNKQNMVRLDANNVLLDVRNAPWEHHAIAPDKNTPLYGMYYIKPDSTDINDEYSTVLKSKKWKPIQIGKRWENMGMAQLNDNKVWLKLRFYVPNEMKGRQIGFFCTAVDDIAELFLNGTFLEKHKYEWGARIHEPINVQLTPQVKYGEENLLVIRVNDLAKARGGGLLGNIFLYNTLPYSRTEAGGIDLVQDGGAKYEVNLHLGDALLTQGNQSAFTADALRKMAIPPYILRDDELILVSQAKEPSNNRPLRVDLNNVSSTKGNEPLSVDVQQKLSEKVGQYALMTIPLNLKATYNHPFSPKQINVQAIIETPSGRMEEVSAFFQQNFTPVAVGAEEEILLPAKGNPWQLNYRPQQLGTHKLQLIAKDCNGIAKSELYTFEVIPSAQKGFLRVSKNDPKFFEFDNGDSYFGIGPSGWLRNSNYIFGGNTRWISTRLLDEFYSRKAEAGSNFDYFLMEFFGRLYTKGGYMDQHIAWKIEHRIRLLEKLGIYWMTCYDDLCRSTVYGLHTMPYSEAQGGPCKSIPELYFDAKSLEMQREHLRYFVSRVSDSPAIMAWSIGDEWQMGMNFSLYMIRSWIKELHKYVKTIDIYEHPHVVTEGPESVQNGGNVIIVPDWYFKKNTDAVSLTLDLMKEYQKFDCPIVNPEGGMVEWTKPEDQFGPSRPGYYLMGERWKFNEAISFHNHLWISLFSKAAVGGTEWLGQFIDKKNELHHATAISNFLKGESLTKNRWEIATATPSDSGLRGFALESEQQTWVWVHNNQYTWIDAGHYGKRPLTVSNASISVPVSQNGNYLIQWWDTRSGRILSMANGVSRSGKIDCIVPSVEKDVAMKVIYKK